MICLIRDPSGAFYRKIGLLRVLCVAPLLRAEVALSPATNFQPHGLGVRRTRLISLKLQYIGSQRLARMYH